MNDEIVLRKNILDNNFQKHLQITTGSLIVAFTYVIGLVIASISNQIDWIDSANVTLIIIVTIFVIGSSSIFFIRSNRKLKRINIALQNLIEII